VLKLKKIIIPAPKG